jgi:hypothetical protein
MRQRMPLLFFNEKSLAAGDGSPWVRGGRAGLDGPCPAGSRARRRGF